MIQKIKSFFLVAATVLAFGAPALVPAAASAACQAGNDIQSNLAKGIDGATGIAGSCGDVSDGGTGSLQAVAKKVVNIFSVIVGIVAVIFVIYGGFRYITSGGDSGSVGNAKNTLIYALVGLVIVALAQVIVHYVLSTATGAAGA
ncbi:MAG: pilin [Candidatus Saccharimonadales bacterium]